MSGEKRCSMKGDCFVPEYGLIRPHSSVELARSKMSNNASRNIGHRVALFLSQVAYGGAKSIYSVTDIRSVRSFVFKEK